MYELLKNELEEVAFMLVDDTSRKEIHSKLINCILILNRWTGSNNEEFKLSDNKNDEIKKVNRRLQLWAKKPSQYNSKILTAYLNLKRKGKAKISEEDINSELGVNTWFDDNFTQMKSISDRNHGKIFDVNNGYVSIWPPVIDAVNNYENQVFENI